MDWLSYFWLLVVIITLVAEAITAGLITIWFAIGAVASFIVSFFCENAAIQSVVFVAVSVLALFLTRPLVKNKLNAKKVKTNADRVIGQKAVVTEEIDTLNGKGQVKVSGKVWSAKADGKISAGETVEVLEIEGVHLIVK